LAERTEDAQERQRQMTFVLVGAGPTGVELAASIAQMATRTLRSNFRNIDPAQSSVYLIEGGKRVLPSFHDSLSLKAAAHLRKLGVKVLTETIVEKVDEGGVVVGGERIECATTLWTAGVEPSSIIKTLAMPADRAGRIRVDSRLNIPDDPHVYVIGDAAAVIADGRQLPGVAQVAIQQGRYVGKRIACDLAGRPFARSFRYHDKGTMAVIGKNYALLETRHLRLGGFLSWGVWALIHLMFLPQLQNRLRVQTQWLWSYMTNQRGSRLIPESSLSGGREGGKAP
jgi:NADH dehydrogenase